MSRAVSTGLDRIASAPDVGLSSDEEKVQELNHANE